MLGTNCVLALHAYYLDCIYTARLLAMHHGHKQISDSEQE